MSTYYKVVRQDLRSLSGGIGLELQYTPGVKIKSKLKQAPLFVLDNLQSAINLVRALSDGRKAYRIFECKIEPSNRKWGILFKGEIDQIVKNIKNKKKYTNLIDESIPIRPHTVLADSVTLGQEVLDDYLGKVYYKVVREDLISVFADKRMSVKYKIKEKTFPINPVAPLMVFSTREQVNSFIHTECIGSYKVFTCYIEKSRKEWKRIYGGCLDSFLTGGPIYHSCPLLPGTVLADSVMLMYEVGDE